MNKILNFPIDYEDNRKPVVLADGERGSLSRSIPL